MNIGGIAFQYDDQSREAMAMFIVATVNEIPFKQFRNHKDVPEDYIPSGSVEWCEKILGQKVTPDYYPEFLKDHLHREIWRTDEWPLGKKVFIKPSDHYKRFTGFVTNGGYKGKKRKPYICSGVLSFENEWRYYVANGKVLTGEWYCGDDINTPEAPQLNVEWPQNYCGAVDFGMTKDRTLALVEANHPFACGWYGKEHELYFKWIIEGWEYMRSLYNKKQSGEN